MPAAADALDGRTRSGGAMRATIGADEAVTDDLDALLAAARKPAAMGLDALLDEAAAVLADDDEDDEDEGGEEVVDEADEEVDGAAVHPLAATREFGDNEWSVAAVQPVVMSPTSPDPLNQRMVLSPADLDDVRRVIAVEDAASVAPIEEARTSPGRADTATYAPGGRRDSDAAAELERWRAQEVLQSLHPRTGLHA